MSTVSAAGLFPSTFTSFALHTRVRVSTGASADGTTPTAVSSTPATTSAGQDQAFQAFAQAILAILPTGSASGSTSSGSGTASGGTAGTDAASSTDGASAATSGSTAATTSTSPADLAQAVANALGSAGTGDGGPDALLKQIESAIDSASAALVQSGASATDVAGYARSFRTQLGTALDSIAASLSGPGASAGTTTRVSASASSSSASSSSASGAGASTDTGTSGTYRLVEKGTIKLALQDGSAVTIKLRNSATLNLGGSGQATGAAAYAAQNSFASSRFSVNVQGSLSADDLTAINDVLSQVDTLATQFFSGNIADAFATGAALKVDPTEIARVSIRLSESESLRVAAPAASAGSGSTTPVDTSGTGSPASGLSLPPPTNTTGTGGATDTTATTGSADTGAASAASGDTTSTSTDPTTSTPATTTSDPASSTGTPTTTSTSPLDALFAYLEDVIATLGTTTQSGSVTLSAKAKLDLLAGAVVGASLTLKESTAAGFLKQIADSTTDASSAASAA